MLRRSSLVAYGEVLAVLGLRPAYALFGHTHRAGPLPDDDLSEWTTKSGVKMVNTGCWVNESAAFMSEEPADNPYRCGFAVELDSEPPTPPRLVNLLDADAAAGRGDGTARARKAVLTVISLPASHTVRLPQ